MIHTRLYLDTRYKSKSGTGNLLLLIINGTDTASIAVNVKLLPTEWDGERVIKRIDAIQLNAIIAKFKSDIDLRIVNLSLQMDITVFRMSQLRRLIVGDKHMLPTADISFTEVFNQYMNKDLSDGSKVIYHAMLDKVYAFSGKKTKMKDIDYKYVMTFNKHLSQTQGVNGRAMYLRHLRAICNYAVHTNVLQESPFKHFSIKTEQTKHRVIDIETLRRLYHFPVNKYQQRHKDYFFLMFFLIGINATDLFNARPDAIVNGRFEYIRAKTHKKYTIKIEPEAQALLDRYKGDGYLVDAHNRCQSVKTFLHTLNDALGMIGEEKIRIVPADDLFGGTKEERYIEPLISNATSYFARHTWATIASDLGISIDVISQALGHSFGNRTTMIYIKPDQSKVDDANRKVIDYLLA